MEHKKKIVRINANVPEALRKRLKKYCIDNDILMQDVITLAVEALLDQWQEKK